MFLRLQQQHSIALLSVVVDGNRLLLFLFQDGCTAADIAVGNELKLLLEEHIEKLKTRSSLRNATSSAIDSEVMG